MAAPLAMLLGSGCTDGESSRASTSSTVSTSSTTGAGGASSEAATGGPLVDERALSVVPARGNLYRSQGMDLPAAQAFEASLDGTIVWLVAKAWDPSEPSYLVIAVLEDGSVRSMLWGPGREVSIVELELTVDPGEPPQFSVADEMGSVSIARAPSLPFELDPLPEDLRVGDGAGSYAMLVEPSEVYPHGILGDRIEAKALVRLNGALDGQLELCRSSFAGALVAEALYPMLFDLDGDDSLEAIVTLSDASLGARLSVFDEHAQWLGEGPAIGQGARWRHLLAGGPLGPNAEPELVEVQTPHIGGIVQYFAWDGRALELVASVSGYSTHRIYSRNLAMAVAADLDGDGAVELLLPTQSFGKLAALRRVAAGVQEVWSLPLPAPLSSNLVYLPARAGSLLMAGCGTTLRLWFGPS